MAGAGSLNSATTNNENSLIKIIYAKFGILQMCPKIADTFLGKTPKTRIQFQKV